MKKFRSDNGTEYVNNDFDYFLSSNGIIHQTTCVDTPCQNGVAERKNRHLLDKKVTDENPHRNKENHCKRMKTVKTKKETKKTRKEI